MPATCRRLGIVPVLASRIKAVAVSIFTYILEECRLRLFAFEIMFVRHAIGQAMHLTLEEARELRSGKRDVVENRAREVDELRREFLELYFGTRNKALHQMRTRIGLFAHTWRKHARGSKLPRFEHKKGDDTEKCEEEGRDRKHHGFILPKVAQNASLQCALQISVRADQ